LSDGPGDTGRFDETRGPTGNTEMIAMIRLDDETAQERAVRHVANELGLGTPPNVSWDGDHHLQGHLDVAGTHMVLIAPRTDDHMPLLLTDADWDALRRSR
jgi:hypothetical protein